MTFLLKSEMKLFIKSFSTESIVNAESLSWLIVFLTKVLILFKVEKRRSASDVVMGIVISTFNIFTHSLNVISKLFSLMKSRKATAPDILRNSLVLYTKVCSVYNFLMLRKGYNLHVSVEFFSGKLIS